MFFGNGCTCKQSGAKRGAGRSRDRFNIASRKVREGFKIGHVSGKRTFDNDRAIGTQQPKTGFRHQRGIDAGCNMALRIAGRLRIDPAKAGMRVGAAAGNG